MRPPAIGYSEKTGYLKVAISFPKELFTIIRARAQREQKSFSEMVVDLCKCGELCLSESDALEPEEEDHVQNNGAL